MKKLLIILVLLFFLMSCTRVALIETENGIINLVQNYFTGDYIMSIENNGQKIKIWYNNDNEITNVRVFKMSEYDINYNRETLKKVLDKYIKLKDESLNRISSIEIEE